MAFSIVNTFILRLWRFRQSFCISATSEALNLETETKQPSNINLLTIVRKFPV